MNPYFAVKEEYPGSRSSSQSYQEPVPIILPPQPMEGLHDTGPPPFLTKTFEMGFKKIDPERWEFASEGFLRGQKQLLKNIRRRKSTSLALPQQHQVLGCCVEVGRFGLDGEVNRLKRDIQVLMMELAKLRHQQQNTRAYIQAMEQRLQGAEFKQQQMMQFLARAVRNPAFLQQLAQQKDKRKELEEAMTKKRRRPIEQGQSSKNPESSLGGQSNKYSIKAEPQEYANYGFGVSELEALALEMQGYGKSRRGQEEEENEIEPPPETGDRELDEGFWDELLSESHGGDEDEEDVDVLAERLGYLGSSLN